MAMALQGLRLDRLDVVAAMLSLALTSGCALFRESRATVPPASSRGKAAVSYKRETAGAEDTPNGTLKQSEHSASGSPRSVAAADRAVTQMSPGIEHAAGTTGIAPESLRSGGSSSVVITQPGGASDPGGTFQSGTVAGPAKTGLALATAGQIAGFILVACCLIGAILWLPRKLNSRRIQN
jgi:hypothetical protein